MLAFLFLNSSVEVGAAPLTPQGPGIACSTPARSFPCSTPARSFLLSSVEERKHGLLAVLNEAGFKLGCGNFQNTVSQHLGVIA